MGRRVYYHCPKCRKRMVRVYEDPDQERLFYLCRSCGNHLTYLQSINGISDKWPSDVFDNVFNAAVQKGMITKDGKLL